MSKLFSNIRFYILFFNILLALGIYIYIRATVLIVPVQEVRLAQFYALTATFYLYLALMATPLTYFFSNLPFRDKYLKARRAIGVSAFLFAFLHALFGFFGELGGFPGLQFLNNKYLFTISISFLALLILGAMAATSFDFIIAKLTFPKWKKIHKFVYLAATLVVIHALLLGGHFTDLSETIPQIFLTALAFLLILESIRLDQYLREKFKFLPQSGMVFTALVLILVGLFTYIYIPSSKSEGGISPFNIHSEHIRLAQEAQKTDVNSSLSAQLPSLQGDRTKRFTVSFHPPVNITPNQEVVLQFQVYDASNGDRIQIFQRAYEKLAHLIIVDQSLDYFEHVHPDQTVDGFNIKYKFPKPGRYHLYLDFQPLGAIEQQMAFTVNVGSSSPEKADQQVDTNLTKTFGDYQVTLNYPKPLKSSDISVGKQKFTFNIKNAKTGLEVTNLKPYLASFGHLVMINQETFEYIHVHPTNLVAPKPDENGGPMVEFMPLGLYGPIKPGVYRVYAQFNPNNQLFTADFTVRVE